MKLYESVAIITGAGRGIGRAIALRLAKEGAALVITGRRPDSLQTVTDEIRSTGGRAIQTVTDVSNEGNVRQMVTSAIAEFGRVDILINNAGITGPTAPVTEVTLKDWEETIAVNLTGAFLCAKMVLPGMIERRSGRVINITSVAGQGAYALRSPYATSKWGMIGLSRTLAQEVGKYNITVNAVAPGPVRGPRIAEVIRRRAEQMNQPIDVVENQYVEPTALKRMVEEDDIAAIVVFLCSDEAKNITGETFTVSAGYQL